jgi:hypothetical protein
MRAPGRLRRAAEVDATHDDEAAAGVLAEQRAARGRMSPETGLTIDIR